jgi:hypothetical protein
MQAFAILGRQYGGGPAIWWADSCSVGTAGGVSAETIQVAVRAIAKVAHAYKLDRQAKRFIKRTGSIAYDDRILSWRLQDSTVSIWTVNGRLRIPFACGERQRELLQTRQGESDLGCYRGMLFLSATCAVEEPKPVGVEGVCAARLLPGHPVEVPNLRFTCYF